MKNEKLNNCLEVGTAVTFFDTESSVTFAGIFEGNFVDGGNNPYFKLRIEEETHLIPGSYLEVVKPLEYIEAGFPLLDKIRIDFEDKIVDLIGLFEPMSADDSGIYGNSWDDARGEALFFGLKLSRDGFLAVINTGYYNDINEVIALIPVVPNYFTERTIVTECLVHYFANITELEAKNVGVAGIIEELNATIEENS